MGIRQTDSVSALQDKIRGARRRVFISSLYIGAEDTELVSV
jgi:hypothetical protein